jgi:hypothetical protein
MTRGQTGAKAYNIRFRALWLRSKDAIDLRIYAKRPVEDNWTSAETVAHVAAYRLVGVSVQDHKRLGLGRWLREVGKEVPFNEDEPMPSGIVRYDEAGQIAYFSIWPLLSEDAESFNYERTSKIFLLPEGGIARIRVPVKNRRGRAGPLGAAAGRLATR